MKTPKQFVMDFAANVDGWRNSVKAGRPNVPMEVLSELVEARDAEHATALTRAYDAGREDALGVALRVARMAMADITTVWACAAEPYFLRIIGDIRALPSKPAPGAPIGEATLTVKRP